MPVNKQLISAVEKYYSSKIREHGVSAKGVDWNSEESQIIRFNQLVKIIAGVNDISILDYGCGYGALLEYIKALYPTFTYTGLDISNEMLLKAKEIHPVNSTVNWKNVLQDEVFDYSIASGIFNVKLEQQESIWKTYIKQTLNEINSRSSKGFSFNMLTSYSDTTHMKDYLYYADPCFYFDLCKRNFSKNVALLHDYGLYEFCILVKK